jgi:biotin-dependent carboxylase-like uncharacterized protein
LTNALVGNPPDTAALEIAVKGPILRAESNIGCALVGAPFVVTCNGIPLQAQSSFQLRQGDELYLGGCPRGMRAYLAVAGGFHETPILGSRSSLTPLPAGTRLVCEASCRRPMRISPDCPFLVQPTHRRLRVIPGPQAGWFPPAALEGREYVVSPASNRMGIRLDGDALPIDREMISEPVCPGSVQITREGQPIILGVDGQTIGGYPKIAVVIDADLDALGQLRPGDRVVFEAVEYSAADTAWNERQRTLAEWVTRIGVQ